MDLNKLVQWTNACSVSSSWVESWRQDFLLMYWDASVLLLRIYLSYETMSRRGNDRSRAWESAVSADANQYTYIS